MRSLHSIVALLALPALLVGCWGQRSATALHPSTAAAAPPPDAAIRLSLDTLLAELPEDTAAACITILTPPPARWVPADSSLLRALTPRSRRVVPSSACPPTYAPGMVVITDSLGRPLPRPPRPPGYVDPYYLRVRPPERRADTVRVRVDVGQLYGGRIFRCVVVGARAATAACSVHGSFLH